MKTAQSKNAKKAYDIIQNLQTYFVEKLNALSKDLGEDKPFEPTQWLRDEGEHGGGKRYFAKDERLFNAASVNVSQVHYDDLAQKNLSSASALSTIIHPKNPHAPSIHIHISLTELRDGAHYWRVMADLNPSLFYEEDKKTFDAMLQISAPDTYKEAMKQGEKYFNIPALKRHRGVSHFYLEEYTMQSSAEEMKFVEHFTRNVIDCYIAILDKAIQTRCSVTSKDISQQLAYHTLYLFQVLTLDRGTTAGLLIHNQNDLGILASLPAYVDTNLLSSWVKKLKAPQNELLQEIVDTINIDGKIDDAVKKRFAFILREHYTKHPDALELQASGEITPNTLENHATL